MQERVTTSWRRQSDTAQSQAKPAAARGAGEGGSVALAHEPARILIVDTDMNSADALELMLQASGYSETRVAYSGEAALAIAADFRPSMVLLDLSLLDMTGYHLAQSLRDRAQSREVRLIALTSSPEHAAREQARAAGFERYLVIAHRFRRSVEPGGDAFAVDTESGPCAEAHRRACVDQAVSALANRSW
jgi:CheY-like chemotaxis protein